VTTGTCGRRGDAAPPPAGRLPLLVLAAAVLLFAGALTVAAGPATAGTGETAEAARGGDDPPSEGAPPKIASVSYQIDSPYPISHEELAGLVTVRPGMRLTDAAIQDAIRALYAKAPFQEIAAYAREEGGKIHLLFHLRPASVVSDVAVSGVKRLTEAEVLAASRIRRGTPLSAANLKEFERAVRKELREKGFTKASVSVSASCDVENGGGRVTIAVEEGSPDIVRSVVFPGASSFSPERLAAMLGVAVGRPFDFREWEKGTGRVMTAYKRAGFLSVHVGDLQVSCEDGEGLCLSARIEEGPRYDVQWEGVRRFSVKDLEKASGIYGDEETSEGSLIHSVRERLLAFYRERGYRRADVSVEVAPPAGGVRPLTIAVREGAKGHLKAIRFAGNDSLSGKRLRRQMISREKGSLSFLTGSGDFDEEEWSADLAALTGLYQKEGFVFARIATVDEAWDERGGMTKTIRIVEGPRYRLREVRFKGNDHFLRRELLDLMGNREGAYVDYVGLERDQEIIASHYRDSGYLDATVEGRLAFEGEDGAVALFAISEGPRYRLGKVVVRGNRLTDPVVVLREAPFREGDPVGERDLLRFQQAVFRTGLYKSVRVQRVKHPSDGVANLVVEVEETLFFEIEFGAGYGTDTGVRGFVGATERNINKRGRAASAHMFASEREQKYLGMLREPWIFGNRWKWEGALTGAYQETARESFRLRKTSLITSISQTFFERSTLSLQYEFSRDRVFDVAPGAVISPEDQGSANIAAARTLFVLDFRDDPFNPRRGSVNSGSLEFASSFLGSEVEYVKLAGQSSWYFPVAKRNTLAVSGRAGLVRPLGGTATVPIQKRFFLGGRTTVRGFTEESLGTRGADGSPTGGNYMVNANAEFRVPLKLGFLMALFLDAGSVWLRNDPSGGFDLRESAGLGLRYVTPIGPVSFDYGWKLDRREGESPSEWHFTIGAAF
jgi:outer membrane protein insertion porin family